MTAVRTIRFDIPLLLLLFLAGILIFTNLGTVYLWEDEAETALVAKTIWTNGIPKITDGKNVFYQEQGARVGFDEIWAWTPWLQFYVASLSLKLLGWNEWAARLPFAIFGFFSVILFFRLVRKLFNVDTARLATLLLVCCVPLPLYMRQCRYYSLVIFSSLWAIQSLAGIEENKRLSGWALFGALFLLFHANYISWFSLVLALLTYVLFPKLPLHAKKCVFQIVVLNVLVNLPWFFLFKPLHEKTVDFNPQLLFESLFFSLEGLNHYIAPFVLFLFIPLMLRLLPHRGGEASFSEVERRWLFFLSVFAAFTIGMAYLGPARVFRYLVGMLPIVFLFLSLLFVRLWNRSKTITIVLLALFLFTNVLNVGFYPLLTALSPHFKNRLKWKFESPFLSYLKELYRPPHGPIRAIVSYLKDNASPNDLVAVTYGDLPIAFYTDLRVIGGLSFHDLDQAREADWVIPRKVLVSDEDGRVMVYLLDTLSWERYEKVTLNQTDFPWEYIPEPTGHQFQTIQFNPEWSVDIYRKLKPEEPSKKPDPPHLFYFTPMKRTIEGGQMFKQAVIHYLLWLREQSPL